MNPQATGRPEAAAIRRGSPVTLLARLSIMTRLLLIVGLVVVTAGVAGIVAVRALAGVARSGGQIYDHGVLPVTELGMIRADMKDVRIGTLNYVTSTTPALKAKHKGKKEAAEAAYVKDLAGYRQHSVDQVTLKAMDDAWQDYLPVLPPLMAYGDAKDFAGYGTYRDAHALGPSGAAETALLKLTDEEQKAAAGSRQQATQEYARSRTELILVLGVALVLVIAGTALVAVSIVRPLHAMRDGLAQVAGGALNVRFDPEGSDELAALGRSLDTTVGSLRETVAAVIGSSDRLRQSSSGLLSMAGGMSRAAESSADRAGLAASAADAVSTTVHSMAAGSRELELSVGEIARSAAEAAGVASEAMSAVGTAAQSVATLSDSSREIGNVLKIITGIAEQTNLLALNATIEAARAGDSGKGFAVVASEVKELAQETARATDDIARRIDAIQNDTGAAIAAIEGISSVIGRINDYQMVIASAVEEQSVTARDLALGVDEASGRSSAIAANVAGVAESARSTHAAAGEAEAASSEMSVIAGHLSGLVERYKLGS